MTFCGFVMVVVRQRAESPVVKLIFINQTTRPTVCLNNTSMASYRAQCKEE